LSSAEVFDPATNGFSPVGSMTSKRFAPAAAPLPGGLVLVVGGETETAQLSSAEVFDPATGTFSSAGIGSMSVPRAGPVATTLQDGRVLVVGGYYFDGSDHELATAEIFGATNTFTLKVRGKRLVVKVQASGSVLVADATTKLRAGAARRRPRLLAKPSRGSGGPPVISVKLRLSKFAKQRLRQKSKVKIRARVTFTPQGGLANSFTAKLKLRAKSKKK
jgi:hypothetical protein